MPALKNQEIYNRIMYHCEAVKLCKVYLSRLRPSSVTYQQDRDYYTHHLKRHESDIVRLRMVLNDKRTKEAAE